MKHILLCFYFILCSLVLHSQKDTLVVAKNFNPKPYVREATNTNVNIYPVPVRDNSFTIKTDRDMSIIKVTNMIGQDIYRTQYSNPVSSAKIVLSNATRGIYLVTISFADGTRIVKKIMIENPN